MTWFAGFCCLKCQHSWREPAPADAWEMVLKVAATAACPLCGAKMSEGEVELLNHSDLKIAEFSSASYIFPPTQ